MKKNGEGGGPERVVGAGGAVGGGSAEGNEVADSDEGWLKLEQEFQQSLMRAANNAEKKRKLCHLLLPDERSP